MVKALQSPVAVFAYGDKAKAQNIIVEITSNGKNFLVGLSLNPEVGGRVLDINSIRNVFPKDTAEWLRWVQDGKLLYADKEKVQALIDQQRMTFADVKYLDLDRVNSILQKFENPQLEFLGAPVEPLDEDQTRKLRETAEKLMKHLAAHGYGTFGDMVRFIAANRPDVYERLKDPLRRAWNFNVADPADEISFAQGADIFSSIDSDLGTAETAPEPSSAEPLALDEKTDGAVDAALAKACSILSVVERSFAPQEAMAQDTSRLAISDEKKIQKKVSFLYNIISAFSKFFSAASSQDGLLRSEAVELDGPKREYLSEERVKYEAALIERAVNLDEMAMGELYDMYMNPSNPFFEKGGLPGLVRRKLNRFGMGFLLDRPDTMEGIISLVWTGHANKKDDEGNVVEEYKGSYEHNRRGILEDWNIGQQNDSNRKWVYKNYIANKSLLPMMSNKLNGILESKAERFGRRGEFKSLDAENPSREDETYEANATKKDVKSADEYAESDSAFYNRNAEKARKQLRKYMSKLPGEYRELLKTLLDTESERDLTAWQHASKRLPKNASRAKLGISKTEFDYKLKKLIAMVQQLHKDENKDFSEEDTSIDPKELIDTNERTSDAKKEAIKLLQLGVSTKIIAERVGASEGTVRVWAQRARDLGVQGIAKKQTSKHDEATRIMAMNMIRDGQSVKDVSIALGISAGTIKSWKLSAKKQNESSPTNGINSDDLFSVAKTSASPDAAENRDLFANLPKKPTQDTLFSPVTPLEGWGDESRQVPVVNRESPPWTFVRGKTTKEAKAEITALALSNLKAQANYVRLPNENTPALQIGEVLFKIPTHNLFHGADRRLRANGPAAAVIGDVLNASVEVPGIESPWHYRIAEVNFGNPAFVLVTAKESGGVEEIVEMQTLFSVNVKASGTAREPNHTDASRLDADSVANLKAAWQELFEKNLKSHLEEKRAALHAPVAPLERISLGVVRNLAKSLAEPLAKNGYTEFRDFARVIAAKDAALFDKIRPYLREAWNDATGQNVAQTTADSICRDLSRDAAGVAETRTRGIDGRIIDTTGRKTDANPLGRALVPEDGSMQQIVDRQVAASQKPQALPPPPAPGSTGNEKLQPDYEPEAFGSGIDGNPIAREEVIDKFKELFPDVAIRGKNTTRLGKALGHFEPDAGIIRSKDPVSLRTIPHEIGHYVDAAQKRTGILKPLAVSSELFQLGKKLYGQKKPNGGYESEGFAELVKYYMQGNDAGLRKDAPAAYNWFINDFAPKNPDLMSRIDAIKDVIDRFQNQSGIQAVRAMTVPDPSLGRKLVNAVVDAVNALKPTQENWIDKGAFISKAMKASGINKLFDWREAMKNKDYAAMNRIIENHPVLKWKLYNGKAGMRAFNALKDGLTDLSGTRRYTYGDLGVATPGHSPGEVLPTFKEIFADFTPKELDDFKKEYAVARVAKELYLDKGLEFGLTAKEVEPVLKKYANNTKFKEALDRYTHYKHGVLHLLVDAGAMSQEQFEAIVAANPIYVKISRHMDSLDAFKKAMMRPNGKAVNQRKGGSQRIEDIFDAGLIDDERVFRAAFQADLFRSIVNAGKLAERSGGVEAGFSVGANWIKEVPNAQGAVKFSPEKLRKQIVDALKNAGAEGANGETGNDLFDALFGNGENLTIFKEKPSSGKKGVVSIYGEDGRLHTYELPENNAEGWAKGLLDFTDGNTFASLWEKWGELAVSAVRAGATQLNPVFALRNLLRDTFHAATFNEYGKFIPVVGSIEGVVKDLMDAKPAQMFKAMGLEMGGFMGRSRLAGARKSNSYLMSKNWFSAQLRKGFFKAIADVVGVTENGTRVKNFENAYDYMLKHGASDKAAQMIAGCWSLDATIDFLRSGAAGQKINRLIPFFNAGVQGLDQFVRGMGWQDPKAWDISPDRKSRRARTVMQGVAWLTTMSVLGWIISKALHDDDDPTDAELPPHERWNYISFGNFRMPVPYEAGYIFASIPKAVLETVVSGDKNALPECLKMFATTFPLQAGSLHELMRNNALFGPLIDVAFNEDWKDSQIVPSYVRDSKESWEWYTRKTTGLSKDLGKALHKVIGNSYFSAPAYLDVMFDGWTGGLYSKLARLAYGEAEFGFDVTRPSDWPIIGTLFRSPTASRVAGNFYDEVRDLERKVGSGSASVEEVGRKVLLDETAAKIRPLWDENGKLMLNSPVLSRKYRFDKMDENNLKAQRAIKAVPSDAATLRKEGMRKLAMSASNPASSEQLVENSLKMLKAGGVTLQEAKDAIQSYAEETGKIHGGTIGRHWRILEAVWNGKEIPEELKPKKRR